jgi:hypothetical protein
MLTCRWASRLISEGRERRLSWWEWPLLGLHLLGCRACRRFRRAVRWLHESLAGIADVVRLPAEARQRLQDALDRAAREQ